mmetsp:Transcript_9973/g.12221  ORF Transcript_9973/g.12221 Transcript_9973/m.12221 type:complete len:83 (+) Transcript_9973:32-280(+)
MLKILTVKFHQKASTSFKIVIPHFLLLVTKRRHCQSLKFFVSNGISIKLRVKPKAGWRLSLLSRLINKISESVKCIKESVPP